MQIDFENIPEFILFKDLTSLDEMNGRKLIDVSYEPQNFKKEERKEVFIEMLKYYKEHNFQALLDEYIDLVSRRSYRNLGSISTCDNFAFNHPIVVMLYEFIGQGLITKELEISPNIKMFSLGDRILTLKEAREMKIGEGVIFADGTLMPLESKDAHKLAALWMILNGRSLNKAIRYTDDCIHPEPIYTSMSEYANVKSEIAVTGAQAIAMYNIHLAKSNAHVQFLQILKNSRDLCVSVDGDPEIRLANLKMFESILGKETIATRKILEDLRYEAMLQGDAVD